MNYHRVRRRLQQRDIEFLSKALKPIRSRQEVGKMLACSETVVGDLEKSALRKIIVAFSRLDEELLKNLNLQPNHA